MSSVSYCWDSPTSPQLLIKFKYKMSSIALGGSQSRLRPTLNFKKNGEGNRRSFYYLFKEFTTYGKKGDVESFQIPEENYILK